MAKSSASSRTSAKRGDDAIIQEALWILEARLKCTEITLSAPTAVRDYLRLRLADREHELFVVLFHDAQNRLIACEELFRGTLTQTRVYPREVVEEFKVQRVLSIVQLVRRMVSEGSSPNRCWYV